MAQYISKAAVVAEIERLARLLPKEEGLSMNLDWARNTLSCLYGFLNTLEVKEVDFDALGILAEHLIACEAHGVTPKYRDGEIDMLEKLKSNKTQE